MTPTTPPSPAPGPGADAEAEADAALAQALTDALQRLLADALTPALRAQAEQGHWPAALWQALVDAGFDSATTPEDQGGAGLGWPLLAGLLRTCGALALPLPLPETLLARWLLGRAGLAAPTGPLGVAPQAQLQLQAGLWHGPLGEVAWGRDLTAVVTVLTARPANVEGVDVDQGAGSQAAGASGAQVQLWSARQWQLVARAGNPAGEPRDPLLLAGALPLAQAPLPAGFSAEVLWHGGALLRCAQTAGALDAVLALCVQQAADRQQFGKPIAAFQAIQHQLAELAQQAGVASAAAAWALADAGDDGPAPWPVACAKLVAAEAAGQGAAIAHAVHGALGFSHAHALHWLTRRLWSWRSEFGHAGHWSQRLGQAACSGGGPGLWPAVTGAGLDL